MCAENNSHRRSNPKPTGISRKTRIAVMGAGAVGGYFGGVLASAGHDVTLIARAPRVKTLRENGFTVKTDTGATTPPVHFSSDIESVPPVDLILFAVKLYSNKDATNAIKPMMGQGTSILTLQNGVSSGQDLAAAYGMRHIAEAAVYIESEASDKGVIQSGSTPKLIIGSRQKDYSASARSIAELLDVPGIHSVFTENIEMELWTKLVSVGAFGTVVAASRSSLTQLAADPDSLATLRNIMGEIALVAASSGVQLSQNVVEDKLSEGLAEAEAYRSSMLQDLQNGNPLEFDWLLGDVIRRGHRLGVSTPVSSAISTVLNPFKKGNTV